MIVVVTVANGVECLFKLFAGFVFLGSFCCLQNNTKYIIYVCSKEQKKNTLFDVMLVKV